MTELGTKELQELNLDSFSFYDGEDALSDEDIERYMEMGFAQEDLEEGEEEWLDREFLRPHSSEMKDIFRE